MPVQRFAGIALILSATLFSSGSGLAAGDARSTATSKPQVVTLPGGSTVRIYRGQGAPEADAPQQAAPQPSRQPDQSLVVGGQRLWIVDPEQNVITACSVRRTSYVGGRYIDCLSSQVR